MHLIFRLEGKSYMKKFAISEKDITLLEAKFKEFQDARNSILIFLVSYISDYKKCCKNSSVHDSGLSGKYLWQTPKINYLFNSGDGFYWSIRNIAIVLGRNRSSIIRIINKMKNSETWHEKLSALQKSVQSDSGFCIDVYHQDIFDLLLDYYEEEYLSRFAKPRHGGKKTPPDINELHRFWNCLKSTESIQKRVFAPKELEIMLPLGWRYRIRKAVRTMFQFLKDKCTDLLRFTH